MKDGLLLLCLLAAFYLGHFPMKRLDRFLQRNSESVGRGAARDGRGRKPDWMEELTHLWYIKAIKIKERWEHGGHGELQRRA